MIARFLIPLTVSVLLGAADAKLSAVPSDEKVMENAEAVFRRPEFARLKKMNRSDLVQRPGSSRQPQPGGNGPDRNRQGRRADRGENGNQNRERGENRNGEAEIPPGNDRNQNRNNREFRNGNEPARTSSNPRSSSIGGFGSGMAGLFTALGWILFAVMIMVVIIMIVKSLQDRETQLESELTGTLHNDVGELEVDHPPSEYPSDAYLQRAEEYARNGRFREAVALVLLGAMSELESRGLIRYRKGLTQRDYYRTVRRHDTIGPAYRRLLKLYEPLGFGRRTAERTHYQSAVTAFRGGFRDRTAISEV